MDGDVVRLPSATRFDRWAAWVGSEIVAPLLCIFGGIAVAVGATMLFVAARWWSVLAGLALLAGATVLAALTNRAYWQLPRWPSRIYDDTGFNSISPTDSLARWRALEEPARSIARPLIDGLAAALEAYAVDPKSAAAKAAVRARCERLDALHREQFARQQQAKLAGLGQVDNDDLAVGDALLEAFRELRAAS
jgi:hypothetical protein